MLYTFVARRASPGRRSRLQGGYSMVQRRSIASSRRLVGLHRTQDTVQVHGREDVSFCIVARGNTEDEIRQVASGGVCQPITVQNAT